MIEDFFLFSGAKVIGLDWQMGSLVMSGTGKSNFPRKKLGGSRSVVVFLVYGSERSVMGICCSSFSLSKNWSKS